MLLKCSQFCRASERHGDTLDLPTLQMGVRSEVTTTTSSSAEALRSYPAESPAMQGCACSRQHHFVSPGPPCPLLQAWRHL